MVALLYSRANWSVVLVCAWIRVLEGLFGRPESSVPTLSDGQMQIWSPWVRERLTVRSPSAEEKRGDQGDDRLTSCGLVPALHSLLEIPQSLSAWYLV